MMTDPEDSESGTLEWRTRAFFDYWRRRRNFIEGLDLKKTSRKLMFSYGLL
jgi:hypothetical protein